MPAAPAPRDGVDRIVEQWAAELPDLETGPMELFGRIYRISEAIGAVMTQAYATHGLTRADFDVLATLRRSGPPYRLSPTALARSMMVTSGGMTGRLRRLEEEGLVERVPDPRDARASAAQLTPLGVERIGRAVADGVEAQRFVLERLGREGLTDLAGRLRQLLAVVDDPPTA